MKSEKNEGKREVLFQMGDVLQKRALGMGWLRNGRLDPAWISYFLGQNGFQISRMKALSIRSRIEMENDGWRYRKSDMVYIEKSIFEDEYAGIKNWQPMPFLRDLVGGWYIDFRGDDYFKSRLEAWNWLVKVFVGWSKIEDKERGDKLENDIKKTPILELAGGLLSYHSFLNLDTT